MQARHTSESGTVHTVARENQYHLPFLSFRRRTRMQEKLAFFQLTLLNQDFSFPHPRLFCTKPAHATCRACQLAAGCACHRQGCLLPWQAPGLHSRRAVWRRKLASLLRVGDFSCCLKARERGKKIECLFDFCLYPRRFMIRLGIPV